MEPETPTTETTVQEHGAGHSKVFPPFDTTTFPSQLLWLTITFGLLYMLSSKILLPRIASIFEARRGRITSDLQMAQQLKVETETAIAGYDKALREARERANAIAEDMRSKIKTEMDAHRAKVEADVSTKVGEAEKKIAASRDKVMGEVEAIASEAAEAIVEQLIGKNGTGISGAVKTALKKIA
ncbi:MAG: F0F1 ATP synthase subunit B [Pseudomonadota bacterium]